MRDGDGGAYFPDPSYSDKHVETLYMVLEEVCEEARRKKMHILLVFHVSDLVDCNCCLALICYFCVAQKWN